MQEPMGRRKGNRRNRGGVNPGSQPGAATLSRQTVEAGGSVRAGARAPQAVRAERRRVGWLSIYKPGQGRYTRLGTVVGAGLIALAGANFLYEKLGVIRDPAVGWTLWVQAGVPVLAMAAVGALVYWVVGLNRRACDFMIATEGEMKKVSWSTRREVIGSTKVVIAVVIMLAVMLFVVDTVFAVFFNFIDVLKILEIKQLLGLG